MAKKATTACGLVLFLLSVFIGSTIFANSALGASIDCQEKAFLILVNNYRRQNGLSPLVLSPALITAAQNHSASMANSNYFSHTGLDGRSHQDRLLDLGYVSIYSGECISSGLERATDTFNGWRNSPAHNSIMLGSNYNAVGIGRAFNQNSTYRWNWTAVFGSYDDSGGAVFQEICRYCYGLISGRIVNSLWQVIPNATIQIDNISVTFDERDGHFIAGMIPVGIHTVYYNAPGYVSQTQVIEIVHNQATQAPTCLLSPGTENIVAAANIGEIFGRVVNQSGRMIPGTCIRINATLMPANAAGEFRFTLVHPGVYTIYYDAPGYRGQTQVVEIRSGQVTRPPTVIMSK